MIWRVRAPGEARGISGNYKEPERKLTRKRKNTTITEVEDVMSRIRCAGALR